MSELERRAAVSKISRKAKEEMKKWKERTGIRAIVPKTKNQKLEMKRWRRQSSILDRNEARKTTLGAASEVRIIKPENPDAS